MARRIADILVVEAAEAEKVAFDEFLLVVQALHMGGSLHGFLDEQALAAPAVTIRTIDPRECRAREYQLEMSSRTVARARAQAHLAPRQRLEKRELLDHLRHAFDRHGLVCFGAAWAEDFESWKPSRLEWLSMRKARSIPDAVLLARTIVNEQPDAYYGDHGTAAWQALSPLQRILDHVEDLETYVRVADAIGAEITRPDAFKLSLELALRDGLKD